MLRIQVLHTLQWWVRGGFGAIHFLQILETCSSTLSVGGLPGDVKRAMKKWKMMLMRR